MSKRIGDYMEHFIKTSDEKVAEELRKAGYQELSKQGKFFFFINNASRAKNYDKNKVIYTNTLCI